MRNEYKEKRLIVGKEKKNKKATWSFISNQRNDI
jgi:hypothetical protein